MLFLVAALIARLARYEDPHFAVVQMEASMTAQYCKLVVKQDGKVVFDSGIFSNPASARGYAQVLGYREKDGYEILTPPV